MGRNIAVEWLILLIRIRGIQNVGSETGYRILNEIFVGFPQYLHAVLG
jgi:hypothetical protein